ncbi:glycosyltransferase [Leptolyngbya sp. NK1-12]|uniref:Glycosyltransferase n=1 Tax=Leptolyngbya sp. NK1-12 TaxID=2547451 RepID=A0AA96WHL6_9CYAN|nr:glycosyltransferase [Leptolyngbya sp. NK1-12]
MNSQTVSVIIPCYNAERFLAEAIESALGQSIAATEIIVVDDGSTDQTRAIVARYPQVKYIYQSRQGVSAARNYGLQVSCGEYIVFLDHDDYLLPNALEAGLAAFRQHPDCGFVFGVCRNIDTNGIRLQGSNRAVLEHPYPQPIYPNILKGNSVHPPARHLFHRSVFETVGKFDTTLTVAEDYDMYLRVAAAFPGHCHNQEVVAYRTHDVSASTTARPSHHLASTLKVLKKQQPHLRQNPQYQTAYRQGKQHWIKIYGRYMVYDIKFYLLTKQPQLAAQSLYLLLRYYPQGLLRYARELLANLSRRWTASTTC